MAWFRVDDSFHTSRKVKSIPARQRFAAIGLWTIAGSWCSQELTDGHVPDYMIREWGATVKVVDSLVDSGLWDRVQGGFEFRSWVEYNPSKDRVRRERAASKARMDASRERRRNETAGQEADTTNVAPQQDRNTHEVLRRPDPTRPIPTTKTSALGESPQRASPPSKTCSKHWGLTDIPPCRDCAQARTAAEAFEASQRRTTVEAEVAERRERAELARMAIDACNLCDHNGYRPNPDTGRPGSVCDHTDRRETNRNGIAKARAALNATQTR